MAVSRLDNWLAFTDASDPTGSATISAGSNRVHIELVIGERTGGDISVSTYTIGTKTYDVASELFLDNGTEDLLVKIFVWLEATIASMSGTSRSYADDAAPIGASMSWSAATFQDVGDQSITADNFDQQSSASTKTLTHDTTSTSDDEIIAAAVLNASSRAPFDWDTLTEQQTTSPNPISGVADGNGGDNSTLLQNDGVANSAFAAITLVLFASSGNTMLIRQQHEGIMHG